MPDIMNIHGIDYDDTDEVNEDYRWAVADYTQAEKDWLVSTGRQPADTDWDYMVASLDGAKFRDFYAATWQAIHQERQDYLASRT